MTIAVREATVEEEEKEERVGAAFVEGETMMLATKETHGEGDEAG